MTYLINFLSVLLYYLVIKYVCKRHANKIFFIVVTMHAIIFRALANPFNYVDTDNYAMAFDYIASMPFKEAASPLNVYADWGLGYVLFNWLIGQISNNVQTLFAALSVVGLFPVFYFYYKTSNSLLFTVVIYLLYPMFYYMGFGVIRQHVAVGFVLLALYNADNLKHSVLWALLALSFHTSACIFFPYYAWRYINKGNKSLWKSVILIVLVVVVLRTALGGILMSLERYRSLASAQTEASNIVPVVFLGSLLLLFYILNGYKQLRCGTDKNIWDFMLYGFALALVGIGIYGMGRMTLYIMYVYPVAITLLSKYSRERVLISNYKYVMLCLVIYLLYSSYSTQPYAYSFYWEQITRTW